MNDSETVHRLGLTAQWTAAIRAYENTRADRLFSDPWAGSLAGQEGEAWLGNRPVDSIIPIILRTRFFDDYLQRMTIERSVRQIVLMAAGLDTRAFRLTWPEGTQIFELDQASVLEEKEAVLKAAGAEPSCQRHAVNVDLTGDWPELLVKAGFQREQPSGWLMEGFLFYVADKTVIALLSEVSRLAISGSFLGFDIVNTVTLTHPLTHKWIEMQADSGAPWIGTMDDPIGFLAARDWRAVLTQAGQPDANHGRWPYPVIPTMMPDFPHNWFVTADKV